MSKDNSEGRRKPVDQLQDHHLLQLISNGMTPRAVEAAIAKASLRANMERPLVRIGFEWTEKRDEVQLRLTCWPSGESRVLAVCHPYGAWVNWRAESLQRAGHEDAGWAQGELRMRKVS